MSPSTPRQLIAAPRDATAQVGFFQAAALPRPFVEAVHLSDNGRTYSRAFAQWRLDYPFPRAAVSGGLRPVLAVAEAILTRGTTPLCSPKIEEELLSNPGGAEYIGALRHVTLSPTVHYRPSNAESQEEQRLIELIYELNRSQDLGWYLIPQVALASLSTLVDPSSAQRGDILLCHAERDPILVEVDGEQHTDHAQRDFARDETLAAAGVRTFRIPAQQVRAGQGAELQLLLGYLNDGASPSITDPKLADVARWAKWMHQLQLATLSALKTGWLAPADDWNICVALPDPLGPWATGGEARVTLAINELRELLVRLGRLYGRDFSGAVRVTRYEPELQNAAQDILIGPGDGSIERAQVAAGGYFLVSDVCFPATLQAPLTATDPAYSESPSREDAVWFLQYLFRKPDFREGQWETVERALRGEDAVVLLPTGAGKSIAFQLAALLLPGRCVVIDPIISLIDDQIDNLRLNGIDRAVGITSQLRADERTAALESFRSGHYLFCYIAPERFQMVPFRQALRALTANTPIGAIVVDEAHCVSEWGHDFRTSYLNLGRIAREYCTSANGAVPPLLALTGTASKIVLKDVQRELGITGFDAIITPSSFDRPELRFSVVPVRSDEKAARLHGLLLRLPTVFGLDHSSFFHPAGPQTHAGLVFCPHVNGQFGVHDQSVTLSEQLSTRVDHYSGSAPKAVLGSRKDWDEEKRRKALAFKRNRTTVLACTSAFGMGIDKPNVRYTVHLGLPSSVEAFYQEAGRAGRDRRPAECFILLSNDDPQRSWRLLSAETPLEEVARVVEATGYSDSDDVIRALYFHVSSFRGERAELNDVEHMLDELGDVSSRRAVAVTWNTAFWKTEGEAQSRAEKALHRLLLIGVVGDYTVDHSGREFTVHLSGANQEQIVAAVGRYASAYQLRLGREIEREMAALRQPDHRRFVLGVAARLISFIYQHVELARRRALAEMLSAASNAQTGEDLRHRILNYLQQTEWDERLEAVRISSEGGMDTVGAVLDEVVSPLDAQLLRAAAGRQLSSYPDVPGLLLLRATAELLSADCDQASAEGDLRAMLSNSTRKYHLDVAIVAHALSQACASVASREGAAQTMLSTIIGSSDFNRPLARALLQVTSQAQVLPIGEWLIGRVAERVEAMLRPIDNLAEQERFP